jgi:hypothetical protein
MVGCGRVSLRRLGRVLGTAGAVTAIVACLAVRGVHAETGISDAPNKKPSPSPTAFPTWHLPTPTPAPTPLPTAEPTPRPTAAPTPAPTPRPTAKHDDGGGQQNSAPVAAPPAAVTPPPPAAPPPSTLRATPPQAQPSPTLITQLSTLPAAVAAYAADARGNTDPYVVGADALAGVACMSSLALAGLRRRGLL